jgi:hypothetical protein
MKQQGSKKNFSIYIAQLPVFMLLIADHGTNGFFPHGWLLPGTCRCFLSVMTESGYLKRFPFTRNNSETVTAASLSLQLCFQALTGITSAYAGNLLRRSGCDDLTTTGAALHS